MTNLLPLISSLCLSNEWRWSRLRLEQDFIDRQTLHYVCFASSSCFDSILIWFDDRWSDLLVVSSMSRADANSFDLLNMRFLHSSTNMDDLDCSLAENLLLRTSHTTTFTLTSSYSTNLFNHQTTTTSTSTSFHSHSHSHSLVLTDRPRRPTIENPYELLPNLRTLNDWMIVSGSKSFLALYRTEIKWQMRSLKARCFSLWQRATSHQQRERKNENVRRTDL